MGCQESALVTNAAVAVAKQHDGELAICDDSVASSGVVIAGWHVSGEQGLNGRRYEVAGVVELGSGGAFNCGIPDFDFVARRELERGDTDGVWAGFGIHHCFNGRIESCGWSLGRRSLCR